MKIKNEKYKLQQDIQTKQATTKKGKQEDGNKQINNLINRQLDNQNTGKKQIISVKQAKSILRTLGILKQYKKNKCQYITDGQSRINQKILFFLTKKYRISGSSMEIKKIQQVISLIIQQQQTYRQQTSTIIHNQIFNREQFQYNLKGQVKMLEQKLDVLKQQGSFLMQMKNDNQENIYNKLLELKNTVKIQEENLQQLAINNQFKSNNKRKYQLQIYIENSQDQK